MFDKKQTKKTTQLLSIQIHAVISSNYFVSDISRAMTYW